jgi:uncharacterized protein
MRRWHEYHPYLRYPKVALAITLLLALPLALEWFGFDVSSEARALLEGDQRNLSSYETALEILREDVVVVISLECDDVFSQSCMEAVRRVSEAFEWQEGLVDVKSFTHSVRPVRRGFSFEMVPLVSQDPDTEELERLRRFSLENPLIRNVMVSPDSRHTILMNTYQRELRTPEQQAAFRREIEAILEPFRAQGLGFSVLGFPLVEEEVRTTLRGDMARFLPAALCVLLGILWLTFRSLRIVGLVVVNQATAVALLPGIISLLGYELNVFTVLLFPLLTAIHLTLLVHLFNAWQVARLEHTDPNAALLSALSEVLKPSTFAALTTAVGLGSLTLSEVPQVRAFGLLGAAGILLVYLLTFGPGLALLKLALARQPRPAARLSPGQRPQCFDEAPLFGWIQTRRRWIIGCAILMGLAALAGLPRLRTDVRAIEFLNPSSPTRLAVELIDSRYGGINVVQLEVDSGRPGGINALPFLEYLQTLERYAEAQAGVSAVYSYAQLLAMMNQIWEQDRPGSLRLPANPLLLGTFTLALRASPLPFLAALSDPESRVAYLIVRTRDMPADQYLAMLETIRDFAQQQSPPGVEVSAARGIHSVLEADRRILRSQFRSAGTTVAVMALMLAWLWRSPGLAFLSLASNALPVICVLAAASFTQVSLNSITIMVAAIGLGIAVDDSVHFLTHWRQEQRQGHDAATALRRTLRVKARPITCSSLILVGVFLIFWLSSFPPVVHFGLMAAAIFLLALLSVLLVLPALCLTRTQPAAAETSNTPSGN